MSNFPLREDREINPNIVFNRWLRRYFEVKNAIVKGVMTALFVANYKRIPVNQYYDSMGYMKYDIQYQFDLAGDSEYDKCMELSELFMIEYKKHNYTDSIFNYIYLNILFYLDEPTCAKELLSSVRTRMNFGQGLAPWLLDLARRLKITV